MKVPLRLLLALIAVSLVVVVWAFRANGPRAAKPTGGEHIIAFGDSLVAGKGASAGHDFVTLLSKRLGLPILNAGISGDTTASALARVDRDVIARNPKMVIVLLGGNDFLRRIPLKETFTNLGSIVERVRARGAAVVLVAISVGVLSDPYRAEFEALAGRESALLVPDVLRGIIGHADLMSDAIHPNDRGYAIVADRVESVLRPFLFESDPWWRRFTDRLSRATMADDRFPLVNERANPIVVRRFVTATADRRPPQLEPAHLE